MIVKLQFHETVYRQYGVLVYNKDAQHAESDRLTVQTTQKHVYLYTHICPNKKFYEFVRQYYKNIQDE